MKKSVSLKNGICVTECNEGSMNVCCDCKDFNNCHFVSRDKRGIMVAVAFSILLYLIIILGIFQGIYNNF